MNSAILPRDTSTLQAMVVAQQAEIEHLNLIIAKLRRMQFGQSSEKIDEMVGQLELALEELETGKAERAGLTEITPAEEAPGKPVRKPLPDHLPRDTVVHAPEHACCPDCGGHLKPLGEDVSEVLDYVPASFRVIRHVRPKLACGCCDTIVQAPVAGRPITRGMAGAGLLAHVLVAKYCDHRVLRTRPPLFGWKRCFTKDEGRPLGVGLQEQASNHHKLRQLRVAVVSVAGKGGARLRQVRFKETNASELLMTCRKVYKRCQNREGVVGPGQGWGIPDYCPTGIRHEGGVTLIQALVRNVGTCRPDVKGEAQADSLRKSQSTDAGHRDGVARSRVEGSVMELDRRGDVVQPCCAGNPRGEDQRG
jgi:hypothetical protein